MRNTLIQNPAKSIIKLAPVVLFAMVLLSSCNNSPEHANYIPKDANVVLTVDVKSLGLKSMGFKDIFSIKNIKKLLSRNANSADTSVSNISNSGIDLLSNAYIFGSINENNSGYGAAVLSLSDKEKFENFAKKLFKQITITNEGDYQVALSTAEPNAAIVWSKSTAILYFQSSKEKTIVKDKALAILCLKKEESLALSNTNFQSYLKESSDLSLWINFEKVGALAKKYSGNNTLSNWKDNYLTLNCNFDKGKVVINSKYVANKDVSEKLDLAKGTVSKETAALIPGQSLISVLGVSLDMTKLYNLLEKEELVAMVEDQVSQTTGMKVKEVLELFNGEIVASFNGVMEQDVKSYDLTTGQEEMRKEQRPIITLVLGVNDQSKCKQLLSSLSEKGLLLKDENSYSIRNQYSVLEQGSHLVLIPENQKQAFLDNANEKLKAENEDLLTQNSASFYLNVTNINDNVLASFNPYQRALVKNSPIETIIFSSEPMKDKVSNGKCLITFKEKDENSLVTLAKISEEFAKKIEEEQIQPLQLEETVPYIENAEETEEVQ